MNLGDLRQIKIWLQLIDGLLAGTAMVAAYYIRVHLLPDFLPLESREIGEFALYVPYIAMMAILAPLVLSRRGLYRHFSGRGRKANLTAMLEASLILFLVGVSVIFFFKQSPSRIVFILFVPVFFFLLLLREEVFFVSLWGHWPGVSPFLNQSPPLVGCLDLYRDWETGLIS